MPAATYEILDTFLICPEFPFLSLKSDDSTIYLHGYWTEEYHGRVLPTATTDMKHVCSKHIALNIG